MTEMWEDCKQIDKKDWFGKRDSSRGVAVIVNATCRGQPVSSGWLWYSALLYVEQTVCSRHYDTSILVA